MLTKTFRLILGLTAATPLLLVDGCSGSDPISPLVKAAGQYQLTLFRGGPPPVTDTYTAADSITSLPNGGTVTWTDGTMVLNSDGTFIETDNYRLDPTGGTTFTLTVAAIPQQVPARFATGTISASTINYQESNGVTFDTFEYKR